MDVYDDEGEEMFVVDVLKDFAVVVKCDVVFWYFKVGFVFMEDFEGE